MNDEAAFQAAMSARPNDHHLRLIYADWLEENGDPRGELLRLLHTLTQAVEVPERERLEDRLRNLVASGVQPVGPFFTNSLGMKFAWIPAGTFLMGSPPEEEGHSTDETQHQVSVTRGFYLGIHPATQSVWREVMGSNPSHHSGDDLPAEQVSWEDAQEFLRKLSARDGCSYRLPTDAEWEFACRAGTTTPFHFGKVCNGRQANCDGSQPYGTETQGPYLGKTSPVGSYAPNGFGLYDMHGNVSEWCADGWHSCTNSAIDPGDEESNPRVERGGSWKYVPWHCRAVRRMGLGAVAGHNDTGFRVALRLD